MISLSMVVWRSSRDELTLEGCEAVGESNEVTAGNGDNGKGLKGELVAAAANAAGECAQAYGEWTSVGGVGNPKDIKTSLINLPLMYVSFLTSSQGKSHFLLLIQPGEG